MRRLAPLGVMVGALLVGAGPHAMLHGQTQQAAASADAAALPAHDSHQGLLIAADPYLTSERSEQKFGKKHPYGAGLLALEVFLRNDTDGPMQVRLSSIELNVTAPGEPRQRLEPLTVQEAAYLIILPNGPNPKTRRSPIPGTGGGVSGGKTKDIAKMEDALRPEMIPGDMIGPHKTVCGFLLFDVDHHFERVSSATLYVPDVSRFGSGEKLLFFEVDLSAATH
jgi:hypothetical protein